MGSCVVFLAQPDIPTTFPFWTAGFPNRKVANILFPQVPYKNKQVTSK